MIKFPHKAIVFLCYVFLEGCSQHKLDESEAQIRAQAEFEHICKVIINYSTNEFIGPNARISVWGKDMNRSYGFSWTNKTENIGVFIGVGDDGSIGGGAGPIDYTKQMPVIPRKH